MVNTLSTWTLVGLMTICILILDSVTYAIDWNGENWATSCDFKDNNLFKIQISRDLCGGKCDETSECTHFVWTNNNNGTCCLKKGVVSKNDAFSTNDSTAVCGFKKGYLEASSNQLSKAAKSNFEQRTFELTNKARKTGRYCGSDWYPATTELGWNDQLANAARGHAQDMLAQNYFDHTSKDGRSPWDRISDAGYSRNCAAAENIAGNSNPDATMNGWLRSSGHCANIMSKDLKVIGVGQATGGPYGGYWVQDFGRC